MLLRLLSSDIFTSILSEWIETPTELAALDVALCNRESRKEYLECAERSQFISALFHLDCSLNREAFHQWLGSRKFNISSLEVDCFHYKKLTKYDFWSHCHHLLELTLPFGNKFYPLRDAPKSGYIEMVLTIYPHLQCLEFVEGADYFKNFPTPTPSNTPVSKHALERFEISGLYLRPLETYEMLSIVVNRCPSLKAISVQDCQGVTKEIVLYLLQTCVQLEELQINIELVEDIDGEEDQEEDGDEEEDEEEEEVGHEYHHDEDNDDEDTEEYDDVDDDEDAYEDEEGEELEDYEYDDNDEEEGYDDEDDGDEYDDDEEEDGDDDGSGFVTVDDDEEEELLGDEEQEEDDDEESEEELGDMEGVDVEGDEEDEIFLQQLHILRERLFPVNHDPFRQGEDVFPVTKARRLHTFGLLVDNQSASRGFRPVLEILRALPVSLKHLTISCAEDTLSVVEEEELVEVVAQQWCALESLHFDDCNWGTDKVIETVSQHCQQLSSLSLVFSYFQSSKKKVFTDIGMFALAEHCASHLLCLRLERAKYITDVGVIYLCDAAKVESVVTERKSEVLQDIHLEGCAKLTHVAYEALVASMPSLQRITFDISTHSVSFVQVLQSLTTAYPLRVEDNKYKQQLKSLSFTGSALGTVSRDSHETISSINDVMTLFALNPTSGEHLLRNTFSSLTKLSLFLSQISMNLQILQILCQHLPNVDTLMLSVQSSTNEFSLDGLDLSNSPSLHTLILKIAKTSVALATITQWIETLPFLTHLSLPLDNIPRKEIKALNAQYRYRQLGCE